MVNKKRNITGNDNLRKSTGYLLDTLKNVGVGLIVSGVLGIIFKTGDSHELTLTVFWGIGINISGFLTLIFRERKGRRKHDKP